MPNLRQLLPVHDFFADIYEKNTQPIDEYYTICQRFARLSRLCVWTGHWLYIGFYIILFVLGSFETWLTNGQAQILHAYIYGFYPTSFYTLAALTLYNVVAVMQSFLCVPPPDLLFFFTFSNVPMIPAIIRQLFAELNALLKSRRLAPNKNVVFVKKRFLHFIAIHQKYNEYVL